MPQPAWGEVWDVDFGVPEGHEQGSQRPAVIVSSDWFNETRAELCVVVPFSKTLRTIGTHLRVSPPEGGLDVPSDAMCEHVRSVSTSRLRNRRGALNRGTMDELTKRIKVLLLIGPRNT